LTPNSKSAFLFRFDHFGKKEQKMASRGMCFGDPQILTLMEISGVTKKPGQNHLEGLIGDPKGSSSTGRVAGG